MNLQAVAHRSAQGECLPVPPQCTSVTMVSSFWLAHGFQCTVAVHASVYTVEEINKKHCRENKRLSFAVDAS